MRMGVVILVPHLGPHSWLQPRLLLRTSRRTGTDLGSRHRLDQHIRLGMCQPASHDGPADNELLQHDFQHDIEHDYEHHFQHNLKYNIHHNVNHNIDYNINHHVDHDINDNLHDNVDNHVNDKHNNDRRPMWTLLLSMDMDRI